MISVFASVLFSGCATVDPLTARWTFGAHEPYPMYRRVGRTCTGGIDGNARWLQDWLDWWDSNAPAKMEEFGFNILHSRFYKGMGWETEKKDLPNVRRFVGNCHRHAVPHVRRLGGVRQVRLPHRADGRRIRRHQVRQAGCDRQRQSRAVPLPRRGGHGAASKAQNMPQLAKAFDLIVMQNENFPETLPDGSIRNRVRDLKFAQDTGMVLCALCDKVEGLDGSRERNFILPMIEDAVFGGIPTDRTTLYPSREPGFLRSAVQERRKALHAKFNAWTRASREALAARCRISVSTP